MIKQIIVMRRDLHMRKGKIASQAGHACVEAVLQALEREKQGEQTHLHPWLEEGEAKICVYVDGEERLLAIKDALEAAGIHCALICDAGHTEFHYQETITCLATEPSPAENLDPITGELPLY